MSKVKILLHNLKRLIRMSHYRANATPRQIRGAVENWVMSRSLGSETCRSIHHLSEPFHRFLPIFGVFGIVGMG